MVQMNTFPTDQEGASQSLTSFVRKLLVYGILNRRNRQEARGAVHSAHPQSVRRPGRVRGKQSGEHGVWEWAEEGAGVCLP